MNILHLSDLHFSSPSLQTEPILLKDPLIQFINNTFTDEEFYLILTGDITYKAQKDGFKEAKNFFKDIIRHTHLKQTNIIVCPGNHDFQKDSDENPFSAFNQFSKEIRDDSKLTFDILHSNHIIYSHNISLLSMNSSYYLDHTFGYVDTDNLRKLLSKNYEQIQQSTYKIAILHHHFLSFDQNDTSMVRNSYQLLDLLSEYQFNFIFHGHQHTRQAYSINKIIIKGISSITESRSNSNTIGVYKILDPTNIRVTEYTYSKDKILNGTMGGFVKYDG